MLIARLVVPHDALLDALRCRFEIDMDFSVCLTFRREDAQLDCI